jgi:drug/metabolite transporter (DMT)-like permease
MVRVSRNLKADLLLAACTVVWGATFVVVKDALADASAFVFLALRFLVAALLLLALFGRQLRGLTLPGLRAGALIGFLMFAGYAFQTVGLTLTTPSKASFITTVSVIMVPFFLAVFGRQRIGGWIWTGAATALGGLYLLTIPATGFGGLNRGDLLVLGCAVMFALHVIALGHYTRQFATGLLTLLQVGISALMTLAAVPLVAATRLEPARVSWTPGLVTAALSTGIVATALAFVAMTWAQKYTTATHAVLIFTLEPVFAGLTSFFFYGERLGWRAFAGAGLILAGILLAELKGPAPAVDVLS